MGKTISEHMLDFEATKKALDEIRAEEGPPKSMPLEPLDELRMKLYDLEQRMTALERAQHVVPKG